MKNILANIEVTIIDLPENAIPGDPRVWVYYPIRKTPFIVVRKGTQEETILDCDLQQPLKLKIGDKIYFSTYSDVPNSLKQLYEGVSSHPPYAEIRDKSIIRNDNANSKPILVG